eukprot:9482530-Pyramimonas_sp.AAC.1
MEKDVEHNMHRGPSPMNLDAMPAKLQCARRRRRGPFEVVAWQVHPMHSSSVVVAGVGGRG